PDLCRMKARQRFLACLFASLFICTALLPHFSAVAQDTNSDTVCRERLKLLGGAVRAYRIIHDNQAPAKLSDLYLDGLVENLGDVTDSASGAYIGTASEIETKSDFTLASVPGVTNLVVREKVPHHGQGTVLAALA